MLIIKNLNNIEKDKENLQITYNLNNMHISLFGSYLEKNNGIKKLTLQLLILAS